jgi:hypothetical protein
MEGNISLREVLISSLIAVRHLIDDNGYLVELGPD